MRTRNSHLGELVARLQTVRDEDLLAESSSPQAHALFERIVASDREAQGAPRGTRRLLAAAAALVTVGAAVVAVSIGVGPSPEAVTPAAAALRQAAAGARTQHGIPPGSYLYVRSQNATLAGGYWLDERLDPETSLGVDCCEALVPQVRELWLGDHAGDALLRERTSGNPQFLNEADRKRWIELGRPQLVAKTPFSGVLAGVPRSWYEGPLNLPADGNAVYEQFKRDAEADHSAPGAPTDVDVGGSMFLHFSDVLREARTTPEQRAAAYEALARVPGVIPLGESTDRFGRRGIAVAFDFVDNEPFLFRHVLVFDPKTGNLLEERREVLQGSRYRGLPAGLVDAYATYEYGVVDALGQRPPD